MEFRTLQYFLKVVEEGNLSKAANALGVSQPALSRQMNQLEEELGSKLFARGRNIVMTQEGILLQRRAEEVEYLMNKIKTEFEMKNTLNGTIYIGTGGLNASKKLSKVMRDFQKVHPLVKYIIYANSTECVHEKLDEGLLDFGVLMEPIVGMHYDSICLSKRERWGLFMKKDCELAKCEYITREQMRDIALIGTDRRELQYEISKWLGFDYSELNLVATGNMLVSNAAHMIDTNNAHALTVEGSVEPFEGERFVFRPFEPELSMKALLVWKNDKAISPVVSKFLDYIKERDLFEDGQIDK